MDFQIRKKFSANLFKIAILVINGEPFILNGEPFILNGEPFILNGEPIIGRE